MPLKLFLRILPASLLLGSSLLFTACGNELVDGDFGGVDLQSFFLDAGSVPVKYKAQQGWLAGERATFYDFGWAAAVRDTPDEETAAQFSLDATKNIPKVALTNPMYFFFDKRGNPLFAPPLLETKTGYYSMPGGKGVRNVNPSDMADRKVSYAVREREFYNDPVRNVPDFQRPVIDVVLDRNEPAGQQSYTGIWEMVRVTVPDGYDPDSIKSWQLLEKGIASGDYVAKSTELLINCPLIDSRSLVIPTVSVYEQGQVRIPQPRMELWYRRKRIDCFLVNGWQTLGTTDEKADGTVVHRLYKATEDNQRFSVMDSDVFKFGEDGKNQQRQVVAPLGLVYIPTLSARSEEFYLKHWVTAGSLPKLRKNDPPGYRPIRWWWNIKVTDFGRDFTDQRFIDSKLNNLAAIDTSLLVPRDVDGGGVVLNFPITAKKINCANATAETDPCPKAGMVCGALQGQTKEEERDFCELKRVRYGELCAPSIAQCQEVVSKFDVVESYWRGGAGAAPPGLPKEWEDNMRKAGTFATGGSTYGCLSDPGSEIGHCYLKCVGGNALQGRPIEPTVFNTDSGRTIQKDIPPDSRCGAGLLAGFRCLPITNFDRDEGGSFCLRPCNVSDGSDVNDALCRIPAPAYFSDNFFGEDAAANTRCAGQRIPEIVDGTEQLDEKGQPKYTSFEACVKDISRAPFPPKNP